MAEVDDTLSGSLHALSMYFVGDATLGETLTRVSELARGAAGHVQFVGITMMVRGRPSTAVFTDPTAADIDQAQYATGRGPCLDSFHTGEARVINSTRRDRRWPEFSQACLANGILSTLSLPLKHGDDHLGAMNLYSDREDGFDDTLSEALSLFAAQASIVLANAAAYWGARTVSEQLQESVAAREVIEQAKGIIMGSMRCSAEQAFGYLVQQSQHTNTRLRVVALRIVGDVSRHANS